ncbi:MAG TPA: peptide chain release factor N(5)-glutamine methyltransferase [Steroidobacteraceae bacterium]|nr:peptide chain release factor N(5)-glutamine methyltransferase [Steroidobacteraceae bacterium]
MTARPTTVELLQAGRERLERAHPGAQLDAEVLLAYALRMNRAKIRSHPEERCEPHEREAYLTLIERRASGEPLAYVIGAREFWSLELAVGPAVLVPRPETELLVERALTLRAATDGAIGDLGTGSGAIALALARERPGWHIVATDTSAGALATARRNASSLGIASVEFLSGDWFAPLAGRRFHLLISNPPYIAAQDPVLDAAPLKFEPRAALTPGDDALSALRTIIRGAPQHLERGGWLLLEHGATQAPEVARELVVRGFAHVRSHRDLAGHERMTEARWG